MNVHDSERLAGLLEEAGYARPADDRAGRRRRLQHLRGAGERRQQALRQPRAPAADQERDARDADRGRRLPGAEGPARDRPPRALGRRGLRHPQHRLAAGAAGAGPDRAGGPGRDQGVAGDVPVHAADPARLRLLRVGLGQRRLQQHLHVLHRAGAAGQGDRPPARATSWPRSRRWSPKACRRSPCSVRTSTPTGSSSTTGAPSPSCCGPAARSTACERVRFTSPHPKDFTDDVIAAMAETPNVMPQLHMPLQSGSDAILRAMRRSYRSERYLGIIDQVRAAMPDAAITTDIIVGFPGETEADFQATLDVVGGFPVRGRLHLPVLDPARHAGGDDARPDPQAGRPGALRAAGRAGQRRLPGRRTCARWAGRSR